MEVSIFGCTYGVKLVHGGNGNLGEIRVLNGVGESILISLVIIVESQ